ncbi:MAG: CocE/NonD family hydrolase [Fimbriimonadaceae bacterium]|nr:CocE/NonD family hydrolase [Fimbriimonadaceae bacterium]
MALGFMLALAVLAPATASSTPVQEGPYKKYEFNIPMRDGVKLYTAVYVPTAKPGKHPMLIERTPYSAGPYGAGRIPRGFGGSSKFRDAGYIFVNQDVRGRFMSEGKWEEIRPQNPNKKGPKDIDESTDAYDTVDFLIKNVPDNNGRVGFWGVSYPGFYAAVAAIDTHPAVKAVSPQAPVSEWFLGDDVHHNGAFFLQDNFDFYFGFGYDKPGPAQSHPDIEPMGPRPDAYKFFLELGSAINADTKYYKGRIPFWLDICNHDAMDDFWKARSMPPQLKNVKCAMLTVGGWFDAEDGYGAFDTYRHAEKQNPGIDNWIVVGPWSHGAWGGAGNRLGKLTFGTASQLGEYFREEIEFPFFDAYLRGDGKLKRPEAEMFETGNNQWRKFDVWPPKEAKPYTLYLNADKKLSDKQDTFIKGVAFDQYLSDPDNPVPYAPGTIRRRPSTYMVEDQRYLEGRSDVLTYQTEVLDKDITIAGPVVADLFASTTGTDADFIVKVIDVYPADAPEPLANAQIQIRAEVMRTKFRNSFSKPEPMTPNMVERVTYKMVDVLHTFKKDHRIMIQVQSSWFPLVDRNPNKFCNIYKAKPEDYQKATIKLFRTLDKSSAVKFSVLP